uniref:Lipid desaturase domain-containing protein n=1 Tax=Arcella intermedia TaxID=1963864 RepID=A0A6B2LCA8_9EUKA|eukprot:TRINITY_DN4689_c0_g1_i1.p1 TRINITY_DN4689_c0_g1~~TRINITY_DN4689_c0_g1_i1.p1  ORF type:complete len:297 (-),score=39.22 TRINITY_DN4689_c0_g1_i1:40-930(-)
METQQTERTNPKGTGNNWLYEYNTDNYMDINNPHIRRAKLDLLKSGYTTFKRTSDITWTVLATVLFPVAFFNILSHSSLSDVPMVLSGLLLGLVFADFMSGLVHWMADTWGTLEVPFFGPTFIRSFREHHVSPTAMCEHDWFETNGDNFMLVVFPLYSIASKNFDELTYLSYFGAAFLFSTSFGVSLTNQIHKWSHTRNLSPFISFLQNNYIILPKENHTLHHRPAFDGYYCITTGWLNPLLEYISFWKKAEAVVSKLTGLKPREDDWKWTGLVNASPDVVNKYLQEKEKQNSKNQ